MQYYDQHMHTHYSPDSVERFENYLVLSDKPLITTEHLDFFSPQQNRDPYIPDFTAYSAEIEQLNQRFDNRIRKGVEVGFTKPDKDKIFHYLDKKDFDLVLLSIHHNGRYNFMQVGNQDIPLDRTLEEYYTLMLEAVQEFPQANVLAHFDYGLRGYELSVEELQAAEERLLSVFQAAVERDIAFELNTGSMYRHENAHLYDYAIGLYLSVGGKMFTVGSDAHKAQDYERYFPDAFTMLKQHGVEKLTVFREREPIMVDLPTVPVQK